MWNIVGHEWAVGLLAQSIAKGNVSHAYLFTGPAHIGKTTLALEFAAALNCTGSEVPCGECLACRKTAAGIHPDVRLISGEGKAIGIDKVRQIQHEAILSPFEGRWRVHILSDFQDATPEAANCLLKTLEEPPKHEVLLLTVPEADLLLPTVVSRCQVVVLRRLPIAVISETLQTRWKVDTPHASFLARLSGGRLGWAIAAAGDNSILEKRKQHLDQLISLLRVQGVHRWPYAKELCKIPGTLKGVLDLWSTWWRDMLLLRMECSGQVTNLDRRDDMMQTVELFDPLEIRMALQSTRNAREQLERNANARLALEVLFLDYPLLRDDHK